MYLAGILGLCMLLAVPAWGRASGVCARGLADLARDQSSPKPAPSPSAQEPQPSPPPQDSSKPDASKADQAPASPNPPSPSQEGQPESAPPAEKPVPPKTQKTPSKASKASKSPPKKHTTHSDDFGTKKTVVRQGGTQQPTTQLAPGMTEAQASQQRQSIQKLLNSTGANLDKLSSRQLTSDQQDTVSQIRKFMEQAKAADQSGDLPRAQNLAQKAQLLSDELVKK